MLVVDTVKDDLNLRKKALNIHESFIVQAPAGSGKTSLLTQRILALLGEAVEQPEECLSITFTKKAAAEMRSRVLNALEIVKEKKHNANLDPITFELAQKVLQQDQKLGWHLLENPNRLQIQTIDAFSAGLAQKMPLMAGLGGFSKIATRPEKLYQEAVQQVLANLEKNVSDKEHLERLLLHLDNDFDWVESLLINMLSNREQWLSCLGPTFFNQPDRSTLEKGLQNIIVEILNNLLRSAPNVDSNFFGLIHFACEQLHLMNSDSKLLTCQHLKKWPGVSLEELPLWQGLSELLLTEKKQFRKTLTQHQGFPAPSSSLNKEEKNLYKQNKTTMQAFLLEFQKYPEFESALEALSDCPASTYSNNQWLLLESLMRLLPQLVAELLMVFQKRGQVDFVEVALSADRALGEEETPSELALKLGYKIRHILMDEFQDTSLFQFRLLQKLTINFSKECGNTLFFVGDPQQSIYRFRRAEVTLFMETQRHGINEITLQPLYLNTNFRSDPKIIEWVNVYFAERFPKQDHFLNGAVAYKPFIPKRSMVMGAEVAMESVNEETESLRVVEYLEALSKNTPEESTAVLVRARSHLKRLLPLLKQKNMSYTAVELDPLQAHPVVSDLICLSNALVHLGDRIAWLSLLRTPFLSLSLIDIEHLVEAAKEMPLFYALSIAQSIPQLSDHAKIKIAAVFPILEHAIAERERVSFVLWLKKTWFSLSQVSLNSSLSHYFNCQEAETFFRLVTEHQNEEDFFKVSALEACFSTIYDSNFSEQTSKIQVMTIHKAKGLEFDNVLVLGIGRSVIPDPTKLLLWEERVGTTHKPYLVIGPVRSSEVKKDPIYQYLRKQEQKRAHYENLRLLYVAATRAKKRLYGFIHDQIQETDSV